METNELIKLRQRFGYTQLDIANMLGLPKSTYNQKENGKRSFKPVEMVQIYEFFHRLDDSLNMQDIFLIKLFTKRKQ